ncbi:TPA: hypothetical protein QDB43_000352 [Burkholderia vietnamiensis]|uniref:hypothetical protein n=1 Tax=Burkholderia pseudomallei TaxID=28450 RepID=UPI0021F7913C|nr:hypothetical protein [Burkholderia pseudomallei]MCW0166356.1 hypothetical protein [Burkholderia pseudomallei]HDR9236667.1 hypothetical protein [Burkholderia vietnamiensis]
MLKTTITAAALLAATLVSTAAIAAPQPYTLLNDLKTPQQLTADGQASVAGYSFLPVEGLSFVTTGFVHGLMLGESLPARCSKSATPEQFPCSIPVPGASNLHVIAGLAWEPNDGAYATSALVVTSEGNKIVGIGQPLDPDDATVSATAKDLLFVLGSPNEANANRATFDRNGFAVTIVRGVGPEGPYANVWSYKKSAFPVTTVPYVAGTAPIANLIRWRQEVFIAP